MSLRRKKILKFYFFIEKLSEKLSSKDIIATDMGLSFTGTHQAFKVRRTKLYTNSGHAPMGWGLPAAIGAYFSGKKISRVICLAGEGGFQMNIQELATVMHNKLPIKFLSLIMAGIRLLNKRSSIGLIIELWELILQAGYLFQIIKK